MKTSSASPLVRGATLLTLAISLALAGCGGDKPAEGAAQNAEAAVGKDGKPVEAKAPAVPVEVATVGKSPISASYGGTASLEAPAEAQVVAKSSGVVLQILVEEGDPVRAGEAWAEAAGLGGREEQALVQLNTLKKRDDLDYYARARIDARIAQITPVVLELRRQGVRDPDLRKR